jgi:catechol 2,3-dioxygenase-like lactoylglutathione lyase family enzyme
MVRNPPPEVQAAARPRPVPTRQHRWPNHFGVLPSPTSDQSSAAGEIMTIELTKDSIDLGIVTRRPDEMLAFYRDTLGFEFEGEMPMPGGGNMLRLLCGTSLIKIVTPGNLSEQEAAPGGISGASGYRYWTISVSNLDALTGSCEAAGSRVAIPPTEIRPGVRIAMVEDPDGNWVEFLET